MGIHMERTAQGACARRLRGGLAGFAATLLLAAALPAHASATLGSAAAEREYANAVRSFKAGRASATRWLDKTFDKVGVENSIDIRARFL